MSDLKTIIDSLNNIHWDFPDSRTPRLTVHSFHWFPGNFIPQIPSYLIQILSKSGDLVLDPFCGSGTTGVEAMLLGRRSLLSDINKTCIFIADAKLSAFTDPSICNCLEKMTSELIFESLCRTNRTGISGESSDAELELWFHSDTLMQLRYIWQIIENVAQPAARKVAQLIFFDTLFDCASTGGARTSTGGKRRHHWGWIADNVRPNFFLKHNAIRQFCQHLNRALDVLMVLSPNHHPIHNSYIQRGDARSLAIKEASVDLIVSSPPYIGMIDYALANRLIYLWMGWKLDDDKYFEIGSRSKRKRKNALNEYLSDMNTAINQMAMVLKPGGFCAIILGESRKFAGATEAILKIFEEHMIKIWGPIQRTPIRRRISERAGTQQGESICVFQKAQ